jgi:hypothetical protein
MTERLFLFAILLMFGCAGKHSHPTENPLGNPEPAVHLPMPSGVWVVERRIEQGRAFVDGLAPVKIEGKWGYLNTKGEVVIQPAFDEATLFSEGIARINLNDKYGYIDTRGRYLVRPEVVYGTGFRDGRAAIYNGQSWGYIDRAVDAQGHWALQLREGLAGFPFSEGLAPVISGGKVGIIFGAMLGAGGNWGYINKKGDFAIPPRFAEASHFSEGLAGVSLPGGLWGFVDTAGELVIKPRYAEVRPFSQGLAAVKTDKKWGYIDRRQELVIPFQFDEAADFSEDRAAIKQGPHYGYLDLRGQIAIPPSYGIASNFSEGLARVYQNGIWGFIDKEGKTVIEPQFDDATDFSGGLAAVRSKKKWGYINSHGQFVIESSSKDRSYDQIEKVAPEYLFSPQFDHATSFDKQNGFARVNVGGKGEWGPVAGGKWGLVHKSGMVVCKPIYGHVGYFAEAHVVIVEGGRPSDLEGVEGGKYGLLRSNGTVLVEPTFQHAFSMSEGMAAVKAAGLYGFIDTNGRMVIKPQFTQIHPFHEGLAPVERQNRWGYIDKNGKEILPFKYSDASVFRNGVAWAMLDKQWWLIDKKGKTLNRKGIDFVFNAFFDNVFHNGLARVNRGGHVATKYNVEGGKWGAVDMKGETVVDYVYDEVQWFENGVAVVRDKGKYGLITSTGRVIVSATFDAIESGNSQHDVYMVKRGGLYGYIGRDGQFIAEPQFTLARAFEYELGIAAKGGKPKEHYVEGGKWGAVDRGGKTVIPFEYEGVSYAGEGFAEVKQGDRCGYVDTHGKAITEIAYRECEPFHAGVASVKAQGGRWGVIDEKGAWVTKPMFDKIGDFAEGWAPFLLGDKYGYISANGRRLIDAVFDNARRFESGVAEIKVKGKVGFIKKPVP